jgi:predicted RNA-binding Zn ribbon-like protein
MKLVGGDPCLDFVNTVGGRVPDGAQVRVRNDKLAAYADLVAFAAHAGLASEREARGLLQRAAARPREAEAVLGRARLLREALFRSLRALMRRERPAAADLAVVGDEIAACHGHEVLEFAGRGMRFAWRDAVARLDSPLWPVARSAARLLTSPELERLRQCGGLDCGWLFLDKSRNRSRQWCTMEDCGNVAKVRRFRERHRRRREPSS